MATGRTPMTRAACTYSLFFSTSVEPRTVRAYCGQFETPIATMSTMSATSLCALRGSTARATPSMRSAIRIAGKESWTSAARMMNASSLPPEYPDTSPRLTPIATASATAATPTRSEMRVPNMIAESTSRP